MRCINLFPLFSVELISLREFDTTGIKAKTFLSFLKSIIFSPNFTLICYPTELLNCRSSLNIVGQPDDITCLKESSKRCYSFLGC